MVAESRAFSPGISLDCLVAEVEMRMKMFVGVAAGILTIAASGAGASAAEKDEVAVSVPVEPVSTEMGIRDEAMMVLVGSALIGAAAAVRRAA